MDIKLILENQLAIMRWIAANALVNSEIYSNAAMQIEKTKERIEQWNDEMKDKESEAVDDKYSRDMPKLPWRK